MKTVFKNIFYIIFCSIFALTLNATPELQETVLHKLSPQTTAQLAAIAKRLYDKKVPNVNYNKLIKSVIFHNDIPEFLKLNDEFEKDPGLIKAVMDNCSFTINGFEVPANQGRVIPVRIDGPFKFSIIAKRGKLASLVAMAKTSIPSWIQNAYLKVLNLFSINISYTCPFDETRLHNNTHYMADLIYEQKELQPVINNPSPQTIFGLIKKHIEWPSGFQVSFKLPQIMKEI